MNMTTTELTKEIREERGLRYTEIEGNGHNHHDGILNVHQVHWEVNGPSGAKHAFQMIQSAEAAHRMILLKTIIRHYRDGDYVDDFEWGHDSVSAYKSCAAWKEVKEGTWWTAGLIASRIFRIELPCCGGKFKTDRSIADRACIDYGHCEWCNQKWTVAGGYGWVKSAK